MNINIKFKDSIIPSVILAIIGLILLIVPYGVLVDIIFTIIGLMLISFNIIPCLVYWSNYQSDKKILTSAILSTILVILGVVFIFWHNWVISVILALWLIAIPIIRIANSHNKMDAFKKEIVYFVIAALLFFTPVEALFHIVIKVFGAILLLLAVIKIIRTLKNNKNSNNDDNKSDYKKDSIDAEIKEIN